MTLFKAFIWLLAALATVFLAAFMVSGNPAWFVAAITISALIVSFPRV